MKMLSGYKIGLNYDQLPTVHESIILSTIEYGSSIYEGASAAQLKKLNVVHLKDCSKLHR